MALLFLCVCAAQPRNDLTGGFRYEVKLGQNSYLLNNAPGYALDYSYRPLRWLRLEAGMEQIFRPVGSSVFCRFVSNANDNLFLVPFGVRYVFEPRGIRVRLSLGGGGAYLNHTVGTPVEGVSGASGAGWQIVAGGDYGLTHSGHFRAGVTARYYYVYVGQEVAARIFTIGPDFTFSFR